MNYTFYKDKGISAGQKISGTVPNFTMCSNNHLFQ